MADSKRRWRRFRLLVLLLLNGVAVAGVVYWFDYVRSPEYQWKRAGAALQRQAWPTAEIHLKNFIAAKPNDVEARIALAVVYGELAAGTNASDSAAGRVDPPLAVEQLVEVAKRRPQDAAVRLRLLAAYRQSGQADAAVQVARELAELGSTVSSVLALAASAALDAKNWDEAESLIERLNNSSARQPPISVVMTIRLHEGRGDTEKLTPLLGAALLQLSQMTMFDLAEFGAAEFAAIGEIMRAAVYWVPDGDTATRRISQSLGVLEHLAATTLGKSRRTDLVEVAARLLAVAKPVSPNAKEKRQSVCERFLRFAEPALESNKASPLVYEQLSRAASASKDQGRALSILRRGLEQHRQLPPERQRELLALHQQCAVRLLSERRLAEAQTHLGPLLKNAETAPIGHLLAAAVAIEEGRIEDAARHLSQAQTDDGDTTVIDVMQVRVHLPLGEWQAALDLLEALDQRWDNLPETQKRWLTAMLGGREPAQFLQAGCLMRLQQPERAEALLKQLEQGKLRTQVSQARVLSLLQRGQRREARDLLRLARRESPEDVNLLLIEFGLLVDEKANDGATRLLTGHIHRFPKDLHCRVFLTQWLIQRGDAAQAVQQLADIRQRFPDQPAGWLLTAEFLLNNERSSELDQLLQQMQRQPAVAHLLPLVQANRSLRQAGITEAAEALRQANPELQRTAVFHVMSAIVSLERGDAQQAFDLFANSLHFSAVRPQVRNGFLQAFQRALQTAKPDTIGPRVEELLEQFPNEPALLLASAELAARRSDFETASQRIDRLAEHDVMPGRPAYTRAHLLVAMGQADEALAELSKVFEKAPQHQAARFLAAQLTHTRGDDKTALTHLDVMPPTVSEELLPSLLRADVLVKLERPKDAEQVLEQLVRRQPKLPQSWLALSTLRNSIGQTEAAVKTLDDGLQRLPNQPDLQHSLLDLLLRTGQTEKAEVAARRFTDKNTDPAAELRWARLFLSANQHAAANEWLKQARQHSSKPSDDLLFLEAMALHQQADSEKREELFQDVRAKYVELIEHNPGHIPALNNLAWLLVRQFKQPAEALAVIEQLRIAISVERMSPDLLGTVIEVYRQSDHRSEAMDVVTESLSRFPNSGLLRLQHGTLLLDDAGDDPDKRQQARQQLELARQHGLPSHRIPELNALLANLNKP